MTRIVTQSPTGFSVSLEAFRASSEIRIHIEGKSGTWNLWVANPADLGFLADAINDYIEARNLRKNCPPNQ